MSHGTLTSTLFTSGHRHARGGDVYKNSADLVTEKKNSDNLVAKNLSRPGLCWSWSDAVGIDFISKVENIFADMKKA